ncbi:MAG: HDIG domain-containing metalloprotein [Dethiobacteria bacterium]|jgi:putative nucleotidyltransferase with HDIG domain|nr:HDIG domain-containing protein [Bacillota bacterium]
MQREEALKLLKQHVKNKNLFKHCLAVEAVMRRLARHFGEDEERWGLAGLLHDVDYDKTVDSPEKHALVGGQILEEQGVDADIVRAVKAHNPRAAGFEPESLFEKALFVSDPVTGLIVAAALIHPDKKLSAIDTGFVLNRFQEKSFARGANREQMQKCGEIGLSLEQFIQLSLEAMQAIAKDLGL